MDQSGLHTAYVRSFKCVFGRDSVMVRSWSVDLPASDFSIWFDGFPIWLVCPCSATTRHDQRTVISFLWQAWFFTWLSQKDSPTDPFDLTQFDQIIWFWLSTDCLWFGISIPWLPQELRSLLHDYEQVGAKRLSKEREKRRRTTKNTDIWRCFALGFSTIVMVQRQLHCVQTNVVVSSAQPVYVIFKVNQLLDGVQLIYRF